ncbi:hypothetical protein OIV83_003480 [Microbotryomycetes sp. JL201]|nr:hypothetical protein OIV83_003480 [Microbotryomycetes sp. JL201]
MELAAERQALMSPVTQQQSDQRTATAPRDGSEGDEKPSISMFTSVTNLWRALRGSNGTSTTSINKRARTTAAAANGSDDGHVVDEYLSGHTERRGKRRKVTDDQGQPSQVDDSPICQAPSLLSNSMSAPNMRAPLGRSRSTTTHRRKPSQHHVHFDLPSSSSFPTLAQLARPSGPRVPDKAALKISKIVLASNASESTNTWRLARTEELDQQGQRPTSKRKAPAIDDEEESESVKKIRKLEEEIQKLQQELVAAKRESLQSQDRSTEAFRTEDFPPVRSPASSAPVSCGPYPAAPPPPPPPPPPAPGKNVIAGAWKKSEAQTDFLIKARKSLKATPPRPKRKPSLGPTDSAGPKSLDMGAFLSEMKGVKLRKVGPSPSASRKRDRPVNELQDVLQQAFSRKFAKSRAMEISSPVPRMEQGSPSWDSPRPAPPIPIYSTASDRSVMKTPPKPLNSTATRGAASTRLDLARRPSNPTPPPINYSRPITPGRQKRLAAAAVSIVDNDRPQPEAKVVDDQADSCNRANERQKAHETLLRNETTVNDPTLSWTSSIQVGPLRKRTARRLPVSLSGTSFESVTSTQGSVYSVTSETFMEQESSLHQNGNEYGLKSRFSEMTVEAAARDSRDAMTFAQPVSIVEEGHDLEGCIKASKRKGGEWDSWELRRAEEGL